MIQAAYNPSDLRYIFLRGDDKELSELEAHLNKIPKHQFQAVRGIDAASQRMAFTVREKAASALSR